MVNKVSGQSRKTVQYTKLKKVSQLAWQPFGPVFAAVAAAAGDDVPLQLDVLSFFALQTAVTQCRWVMILN